MDRYYGVITSTKESALKFIMDLSAATTTDKGGPIKAVTEYSLTSMTMGSYNRLMNHLQSAGYITVMPTDDAINVVLESLTKDQISPYDAELNPELDVVAALGENIYIVVHPADSSATEQGDFNWRSRIRIIQKVITTEEVEPEESSEEEGEEEDPVEPETVTTVRTNSVDLIALNSNNNTKYIAYEITSTYSGDALIKIATTDGNGFPAEEDALRRFLQIRFTQLNIKAYKAWAESDAAYIAHVDGVARHKAFNSVAGAYGGFVIHQMKKESSATTIYDEGSDSVTAYGLTIFWTDGTPLYTWSDSSEPWDTVTEAGWGGVNRQIGRTVHSNRVDPEDQDSDPIIKMGALGPIFCPSMNDVAKYAKWMVQGPHDYSYFDNSGHLYLKGLGETSALGNSNDNVFFMDYGIALWDGPLSNFKLSNRSVPDIYPDNEGLYIRPHIENLIPNGGEYIQAYFDGKKGLNPTIWQSINDEGCDMGIINGATANEALTLRHGGYGHFLGKYLGKEANDKNTAIYIVLSVDYNDTTELPTYNAFSRVLLSFFTDETKADNTTYQIRHYALSIGYDQGSGAIRVLTNGGSYDNAYLGDQIISIGDSSNPFIKNKKCLLVFHRAVGSSLGQGVWRSFLEGSDTVNIVNNSARNGNRGDAVDTDGYWFIGALNEQYNSVSVATSANRVGFIAKSVEDMPLNLNYHFLGIGWEENGPYSEHELPWDFETDKVYQNMEYLMYRYNMVSEFVPNKTYPTTTRTTSVGYCMHEGKLYRVKASAGTIQDSEWVPEHWELRSSESWDEN